MNWGRGQQMENNQHSLIHRIIRHGWHVKQSLCSSVWFFIKPKKNGSPRAALGWPIEHLKRICFYFFQFSKEIKKFPSSSPRLWCQTVWVSAKLFQTLSCISINLSYGSSAFTVSVYNLEAKTASVCHVRSGHMTHRHNARKTANRPCQTKLTSFCNAGFGGILF